MLNVFSKTTPWMVASLLAATSLFGQSQGQVDRDNAKCRPTPKPCEKVCEPVPQIQLNPAYNAPARIDVRGCWDVYVGGSFIYWQAKQDNMDLGVVAAPTAEVGPSGAVYTGFDGQVAHSSFSFQPGFKVHAGVNLDQDGWDAYAEYTWFHFSKNSSYDTTGSFNAVFPVNGSPYVFDASPATEYTSVSQNWKLKMDFLDMAMARQYYVGTRLTFRPAYGARVAWIRQKLAQTYTNTGAPVGAAVPVGTLGITNVNYNYASWAIGPMFAINTNWNLGEGVRIIGNAEVDVLYTHYNTVNFKQIFVPTATGVAYRGTLVNSDPDALRAHLDLEMGLGWGSYFDCNNWHVDLAATYGFQMFWDQNMFPHMNSTVMPYVNTAPNGNIYVQGLTFTARLDF